MQPPVDPNPNLFELERIKSETGIRSIDYSESLPSTNDRAIELAKTIDDCGLPHVVLTSIQTQGRGRNDHRWLAGEGSLTFSIMVDLKNVKGPPGLIPASVALAVCEAIEKKAGIRDVKIKWPNDILLENGKVGGILIESVVPQGGTTATRVVIGIGLNVNNEMESEREAILDIADRSICLPISLIEVTQKAISMTTLLIEIVRQVIAELRHPQSTVKRYHARSYVIGKSLSIEMPDASMIHGQAMGISHCGGLELALDSTTGESKTTLTIVSGRINKVESA